MRRAPRLAVLAFAPLLLAAAADPAGDVGACRAGGQAVGDPPDLVRAEGAIVESGTAARWTLTFDRPPRVPDRRGRPFRVDVVIHDPSAPAVSFAYYRRLNRIVRFDATTTPTLEIYLLPERAQNVFSSVTVDGAVLTMQVPGRIVTRDLDLEGPNLRALRWGVVVRDERACDFLGDGRPTRPLAAGPSARPSSAPTARASSPVSDDGGTGWLGPAAIAAGLAGVAAAATLLRARRRSESAGQSPRPPRRR